MMKEIKRIKSS